MLWCWCTKQNEILTGDKIIKASFKLSFMLLLVVPSFPFAKQRSQLCRWMCVYFAWVTAGITCWPSGEVVKTCHKYRLDVFPEMERGRRSSALCNPEEQTEISSKQIWFFSLRTWPNLDFPQKIERLKAELHLLDAAGSGAGRHLFFVDTEREGEAGTGGQSLFCQCLCGLSEKKDTLFSQE